MGSSKEANLAQNNIRSILICQLLKSANQIVASLGPLSALPLLWSMLKSVCRCSIPNATCHLLCVIVIILQQLPWVQVTFLAMGTGLAFESSLRFRRHFTNMLVVHAVGAIKKLIWQQMTPHYE